MDKYPEHNKVVFTFLIFYILVLFKCGKECKINKQLISQTIQGGNPESSSRGG